ncbi:MAG: hypothetical protein B7Z37_24230, partial [Verrucomicrobia bacterium 12-59-8]
MKMIWKLESEPELAALSSDELKLLVREVSETPTVQKPLRLGLLFCALCGGAGSLIGDEFSVGIYGAGLGGGIGGLVYSQVRMRAILRWIRTQDAV